MTQESETANAVDLAQIGVDHESRPTRLSRTIVLLIFLIPVFAALAYGAVETWAFAAITLLTALIGICWASDSLFKGEFRIGTSSLQVPFAALIAIGTIQLLPLREAGAPSLSIPAVSSLSINPYATRIAVIQIVVQLLFFAAAYVYIDSGRRLKLLTYFLVIFAASMSFFGILQWLADPVGIYGWRPTPQAIPFSSFVNQHHFAAFMEMSIGLTLGLLFGGAAKKDKRLLLVIAFVLMAVAVVLTGSRGGLLSTLAVLIFVAAFGFSKNASEGEEAGNQPSRKLRIFGAGALFIALLVGLVFFLGGDASLLRGAGLTGQADFSSGRFHFWSVALKIFFDYPLIGAGLDTFGTAFPKYDSWNGLFRVEQAHNDYLQILSDAGIAGFACVAAFVYLLFRNSMALIKAEKAPLRKSIAVGALAGSFGILVHSFFDFPMRTPANAFIFLLLVVLATADVKFPIRHRTRRH